MTQPKKVAADSGSAVERLVMLPKPDGCTRVETGAVQFGDDWPGVFIRGDSAAYYAMIIDTLLWENKTDPISIAALS